MTRTVRRGRVFSPLLKGEPWRRKAPLFFQFMDNRAIRTADWTLAEVDGAGWELFRIVSDPFENEDLGDAARRAADLEARWLPWWREQSGQQAYHPESTKDGPHYRPQGDRGSGAPYQPSAMPAKLADRYPVQ